MKPDRFEAIYGALGRLLDAPGAEDRDAVLEEAFASASANPHLVARAAQVVAAEVLPRFEPVMLDLYERFYRVDDPGCTAKTALADALDFVDCEDDAPFRRGLEWREPVAGDPPGDAAANLRCRCCLALARLGVEDVLHLLADALDDPIAAVRAAAAEASAFHGAAEGAPLLRFKLRVGDREPRDPHAAEDVIRAVLAGYLKLAPDLGRPIAASMLADGRHTMAVLVALGEARAPYAETMLGAELRQAKDAATLRAAIVSLLMLRSDAANRRVRTLARGKGKGAEFARKALADFGLAPE